MNFYHPIIQLVISMLSITSETMRKVDELAVENYGIKLVQMMELAGFSLATLLRRMFKGSIVEKRIVVLAGKGNNGGGGLVASRHLGNWGANVAVILSQRDGLKESVKHQLRIIRHTEIKTGYFKDVTLLGKILSKSDLIIDALLGYSLKGNPRHPVSAIINGANKIEKPILALDLPSGLDATDGTICEPCIKAKFTLTLALPKKGLLVEKARSHVGRLFLADIGIPSSLYKELGIYVENIFIKDNIVEIF